MKSLHRQKGLSLIGVGILVFMVVFFGILIVKMSGSYFDHMSVKKMVENGIEGQNASRFSTTEFYDRLQKNMEINQVSLKPKEVIKIDKRKTPVKIVIDYEKRVHLFSNVDVVMMFHEEYEL